MAISPWLESLRWTYIVDPVLRDPRNTGKSKTLLGYSMSWLFFQAIGGGQASFDEEFGGLLPHDRVLLYAYLNQKGHVGELTHAFSKLLVDPQTLHRATVIDIGCGPFTSGLALANVVGSDVKFRYFGFDISKTMCDFGSVLADAAKAAGGLSVDTAVTFAPSLDPIDFGARRADRTVVILSYLLASKSIDVDVLVQQIVGACDRISVGPVELLYTNSSRPEATASFPRFSALMAAAGFELREEGRETLVIEEGTRNIHYALFVRPRRTVFPIGDFKK